MFHYKISICLHLSGTYGILAKIIIISTSSQDFNYLLLAYKHMLV